MKRQILRHLPTLIGAWVLLATATVCTSAHAQWLPDRKYKEGPGIRVGERLELHPGIALRGGYDTNVFRADSNLRSSGILAITPHLNLSSVGPQRLEGQGEGARVQAPPKLQLESGASVSYFYYFQDAPPKGVEVDVDASLTVLPQRPVHGTFEMGYGRSIRAFSQPGAGSTTVPNYNRNDITPAALIGFSSRGGVFNVETGYRPRVTIFEKGDNDNDFSYLNLWRSEVPLNISWKFLPHTALIHETEVDYQKYLDDTGTNVAVTDGTTVRSRLGVNGAVTKAISLQALAGFAAAFYKEPVLDEYQEPVGEVTLTYRFLGDNKLSAGYTHDVTASYTGAWQQFDRGGVELSMLLGGAFSLSADASVGRYVFGRVVDPDGTGLGVADQDNREDIRVDFGLHGEYRVTNYLAFMADFTGQVVSTDFEYRANIPGAVPDPAEFTVYQVFGGVRAFY